MDKEKVLCCCSGGIDSTAMVFKLREEGYDPIPCYIDYGQKTRLAEVAFLYQWFGEALRIYHFNLLDVIKGWATNEKDDFVPGIGDDPNLLFIPGRNIFFLLRLCVAGHYEKIYNLALANHQSDTICGDCKPPFLMAFEAALSLGMSTRDHDCEVRILRPVEHMTKGEVVQYCAERMIPIHKTWSCYSDAVDQDKNPDTLVHCGICWNCIDRKKAFKEAGVEDPTRYQG